MTVDGGERIDTRGKAPWYRRGPVLACTGATLVLAGALAWGIPVATAGDGTTASAATSESSLTTSPSAFLPGPGGGGDTYGGYDTYGSYGGYDAGAGYADTNAPATTADAEQSTGVVLIDTVLGYDDAAAAGSGIVLTADGLVLTNNHVIDDATEITVTIGTTGESYSATLVGTDAEDDVALLQLEGASGLATATIDEDAESVGDAVTAVGNAEGGGVLLAAAGAITDVDSRVTTASSSGTASETLDGVIEFTADVVGGDSGGALLDADGEVIGVTTAASTGTGTTVAYAIPIENALAIVDQILGGDESDGVRIGYPAFLGVQTANAAASMPGYGGSGTSGSGALIAGVIDGTPAAQAGLTAGSTITAIDGTAVADAEALSDTLSGYAPGDTVTITWTDANGASHSASVTLIEGPA